MLIKEDEKKELRSGCVYETEMRINLKKSTADKIKLNLRMSQGKKTEILFDLKRSEAYFDRNNSDGWSKGVARCPLNFVLIFLYSINNLLFLTIHRFLPLPLQSPPPFHICNKYHSFHIPRQFH
ncbi:MAG: GH32 C-terminal domain-containing protein [Agathobacter rectalis]